MPLHADFERVRATDRQLFDNQRRDDNDRRSKFPRLSGPMGCSRGTSPGAAISDANLQRGERPDYRAASDEVRDRDPDSGQASLVDADEPSDRAASSACAIPASSREDLFARLPVARLLASPTRRGDCPSRTRSRLVPSRHCDMCHIRRDSSSQELRSMSRGLAPPKLLDRVREAIRVRHYSRRTESAYVHWIRRYILFHKKRHPSDMVRPRSGRS